MTGFGQAVDAALEACVVPGFSRIGLAVRLLPEFTAGEPPAIDGKAVIITGATSGIGYAAAVALARPARRSTFSPAATTGPSGPGAASLPNPAARGSATGWPIWRTWPQSALSPANSGPAMTGSRCHPQRGGHSPAVPRRRRRDRADGPGPGDRAVPGDPPADARAARRRTLAGDHRLLRRDVHPARHGRDDRAAAI